MPALDFTEIPAAHLPTGRQDTFELFARDYCLLLGFEILSGPDRGQDGGRDLIVLERRKGIMGETEVRWLVSCKHKAHSNSSVLEADEPDIAGRLDAHQASGFIGFYSTVITSGLRRRLESLAPRFQIEVIDHEKIEARLISSADGWLIAKRYFPNSYATWEGEGLVASNILDEYHPLSCQRCGKDLLPQKQGNLVHVWQLDNEDDVSSTMVFVGAYWACFGACDDYLENYFRERRYGTNYDMLPHALSPTHYLNRILRHMIDDGRAGGRRYTREYLRKLRTFYAIAGQVVLRSVTTEEIRSTGKIELSDWLFSA